MSEKNILKNKSNSETLIKYDKHSVRVYGILAVLTIVYFLLSVWWMFSDIPPIRIAKLDKVFILVVLFGVYFGIIVAFYLSYHWINAIFYLKRLERHGYEVPENRQEYRILERLPKRDNMVQIEKQEYHKGSKILLCLSVLVAAIMLALSGYYFYKWHFFGETARTLLVLQLIADAFWLIPISIFHKGMNIQKYKDDVEVDINRKTRMNVVSGIMLLIILLLIASYIKVSAHSMTRYNYESWRESIREWL